MNGQFLSIGLKKLVVPLIANSVSKKFEPNGREEILDKRINRLEDFINSGKGNLSMNTSDPLSTHITPSFVSEPTVATSCIACARSHLATVAASTKEAIRFARTEGIMHIEVQTRLATAEEEIVALERYDWSPERVLNSPQEHQEIINKHLPTVRELRQEIGQITTVEQLIICAGKSGKLLSDYRMDVLKLSMK